MLSIVIPAFNEARNIPVLLRIIENSLNSIFSDYEVVIIDDHSSDETWRVLNEESQKYQNVRIFQNDRNLGILKTWQKGLEYSRFELACLIDADLQTSPEDIGKLWSFVNEKSYEVVQGVRVHVKNTSIGRSFTSKSLNWILNHVFNQDAADSKSGFVIAPRESLIEFCREFQKYKYGQTFLGIWLRKRHGNVIEVDTEFRKRYAGVSFLKSYKIPFAALRVLFEIFLSRKIFRRLQTFIEIQCPRMAMKDPLRTKNFRRSLYFLLLPLHTWNISRRLPMYYQTVSDLKFESLENLQSIQSIRLQKLLAHARISTKHYKSVVRHGLCDEINGKNYLDLLSSLPILEKSTVRHSAPELWSNSFDFGKLYKITTSGSTGSPLSLVVDDFQLTMRFATTLCALENLGWKWGDAQLRLWHQTLGMSLTQIVKEKLDAQLLRRKFVPAFKMTHNGMDSFMKLIERKKPSIIDGYAESLNMIALSAKSPLSHKPTAVLSSAQELTENTRINVETIFGCPVLNKYGAREFSGMAYECAEGRRLHVAMESYIIEVLSGGEPVKPGEIGEIFVTDLNNWSMPIVRYAIGDLAILGEYGVCVCGRDTQTLQKIIGRTQALVYGTNGVILPGTFFSHLFKDFYLEIESYQIFQSLNKNIEIRYVPTLEFKSQILDVIASILRKTLGQEIKMMFKAVDSIELGRTGKRQSIVSEISPNPGEVTIESIKLS